MALLYEVLNNVGAVMANHESDLYVRFSHGVLKIVKESGVKFSLFTSTDGRVWIEVPFMYEPWWRARSEQGLKEARAAVSNGER